jgi:hypothetical protein
MAVDPKAGTGADAPMINGIADYLAKLSPAQADAWLQQMRLPAWDRTTTKTAKAYILGQTTGTLKRVYTASGLEAAAKPAASSSGQVTAQGMGSQSIGPDDFARDAQGNYWIVGGGYRASVPVDMIRDYYVVDPAKVQVMDVGNMAVIARAQHPRYKEIETIKAGGTVAPPAGAYSGAEYGYPNYQPPTTDAGGGGGGSGGGGGDTTPAMWDYLALIMAGLGGMGGGGNWPMANTGYAQAQAGLSQYGGGVSAQGNYPYVVPTQYQMNVPDFGNVTPENLPAVINTINAQYPYLAANIAAGQWGEEFQAAQLQWQNEMQFNEGKQAYYEQYTTAQLEADEAYREMQIAMQRAELMGIDAQGDPTLAATIARDNSVISQANLRQRQLEAEYQREYQDSMVSLQEGAQQWQQQYQQGLLGLQGQELAQTGQYQQGSLAQQAAELAQTTQYQQGSLGQQAAELAWQKQYQQGMLGYQGQELAQTGAYQQGSLSQQAAELAWQQQYQQGLLGYQGQELAQTGQYQQGSLAQQQAELAAQQQYWGGSLEQQQAELGWQQQYQTQSLAWQKEQQQLEMAHEMQLAQLQQTGRSMRPNARWV